MNIPLTHPPLFNKRFNNRGLTLIEISLVIALLLGLIAVVFMGIGAYRKGADKAKCKIQLAQTQKAIRAHCNFNNLNVGDILVATVVFGPGLPVEVEPACPSGGTIAWQGVVPAISTAYGNCNYTDVDGVTTHILTIADFNGW